MMHRLLMWVRKRVTKGLCLNIQYPESGKTMQPGLFIVLVIILST